MLSFSVKNQAGVIEAFSFSSRGKELADLLVGLLSSEHHVAVIVICLFLIVPWICLQFVVMVFPGQTYYFSNYATCDASINTSHVLNLRVMHLQTISLFHLQQSTSSSAANCDYSLLIEASLLVHVKRLCSEHCGLIEEQTELSRHGLYVGWN